MVSKETDAWMTNGWVTEARINVIGGNRLGGNRPSIIGRDLMQNLGLQIVQRTPEQKVMSVQGEQPRAEMPSEEDSLVPWQTYFSEQFNNLFHRVGKIKNYKVHAEIFERLMPIQQKRRRVPITLRDKVDIRSIITVKKDGSVKLALESWELNNQVHKKISNAQYQRAHGHRRTNDK